VTFFKLQVDTKKKVDAKCETIDVKNETFHSLHFEVRKYTNTYKQFPNLVRFLTTTNMNETTILNLFVFLFLKRLQR